MSSQPDQKELVKKLSQKLNNLLEAGRKNINEYEPTSTDEYGQTHRFLAVNTVDFIAINGVILDLLERYKNFLEELRDVITKALKRQEPLSPDELRKYLLRLYKIAQFKYKRYEDPTKYYINYYRKLNKAGKLEVLSELKSSINNVLHEIKQDIKQRNETLEELEAEWELDRLDEEPDTVDETYELDWGDEDWGEELEEEM